MLKNEKKIMGYTRVSTQDQDNQNQIIQIKKHNENVNEFLNEKISTGKKLQDRKLWKLINEIESKSIIYITSLDRLARNVGEVLEILKVCKERDITIHIIKIGINLSNEIKPIDTMFIQMLSSFAEMEKESIKDRVLDGLEKARTNGKKLGRQKGQVIKSKLDPYKKEIMEYHKKGLKPSNIVKLLNDRISVSEMTLYRFIKKNNTTIPN